MRHRRMLQKPRPSGRGNSRKGAMFATVGMKPEDRLKIALSAAATFSAGVAGPFNIVKLSAPPPEAPVVQPAKKPRKKAAAK
ncbi:MAG: hypothetical protein ABSB40_13985 [Nitrososphaeria archaeon]